MSHEAGPHVGIGVGTDGSFGVGVAEVSWCSRSELAARAAPPAKPPGVLVTLVLTFGLVLLTAFVCYLIFKIRDPWGWAVFVGGVYFIVDFLYVRGATRRYRTLIELWETYAMCLRCGEQFEQPD